MLRHHGATVKMYGIIYVIALKWVKKGRDFNLTWCHVQNPSVLFNFQ